MENEESVQFNECQPISPAYEENNITVVFSCSDFFVPYLGVSLSSLICHSSERFNYDIIVQEKNIKEHNKVKLKRLVDGRLNVSLRFVNVEKYVYKTTFYLPENNPEMSEETYYTVLVPWALKNYPKALVLDCDIVVCRDVAELFFEDLHGNYMGAAKEYLFQGFLNNPHINIQGSLTNYCRKTLEMPNEYDYYNGGVLLFDLVEFRRRFTLESLLEQISKNKFNIVEQDLLNKICCGHIFDVGYEWNFMACLSPGTISQIELVSEVEQKRYEFAKRNMGILHYITMDKPWKYPELQYADLWWEECRKTAFYEICLYRMATNAVKTFSGANAALHDSRSGARKLADKILPKGSYRREFVKLILPKDSHRWKFCKQIYKSLHDLLN